MSTPAATAQPVSSTAELAKPAKKQKESKKKGNVADVTGQMASLELTPPPNFFKHRIDMFDKLLKEYKEFVAAQPRETVSVSLPDGKTLEATTWETSPLDLAKTLSQWRASSTLHDL
jgi:threonyl-tRNA synthetase